MVDFVAAPAPRFLIQIFSEETWKPVAYVYEIRDAYEHARSVPGIRVYDMFDRSPTTVAELARRLGLRGSRNGMTPPAD
jgi:hypothetical protein